MKLKHTALCLVSLCSFSVFGQDSTTESPIPETKISYLDSLKLSFVHHDVASCVDSLWMKELSNMDIYNDLSTEISSINIDENVDYELSTELLKERLKEMDARSPFNIEYNVGLENVIKSFLKNRKHSFERLMAISEYYFPTFEEALAKKNVPLEIKYLAIVESALNPKAVSRMGATGLWQFMYQTGKEYNLQIDSFVDERSDPLKASAAAAQYMSKMYTIFGDWDLVLASYNSGPGNVAKAIRRSGGQQNYWNIRKHLPKETQGYVPAFLATMYIYEYHKEHGIEPKRALVKHFDTDTVMVQQKLTFKQISNLLDIPVAQLELLNPSYKINTVPVYNNKKHFIRLPLDKIAIFTSNEDKIYAYADYEANQRERPYTSTANTAVASTSSSSSGSKTISSTKYHKIKRGESLGLISNKYGVSVSDLKKWNRLRSNVITSGRSLKIITYKRVPVKIDNDSNESAIASNDAKKANVDPAVDGFYTVKSGDNLGEIANTYNVSVADLKQWNDLSDSVIKVDSKLIVALKSDSTDVASEESNKTIEYVVVKGDNLKSIATKFKVSVDDLKQWNELVDANVLVGKKLVINKSDDTENEESAVAVAPVSVKKDIIASSTKKAAANYHSVRNGDSLFSIAKKYPGITINDIKKWNGIKDNNLRPGMKLKISG